MPSSKCKCTAHSTATCVCSHLLGTARSSLSTISPTTTSTSTTSSRTSSRFTRLGSGCQPSIPPPSKHLPHLSVLLPSIALRLVTNVIAEDNSSPRHHRLRDSVRHKSPRHSETRLTLIEISTIKLSAVRISINTRTLGPVLNSSSLVRLLLLQACPVKWILLCPSTGPRLAP